MTQFWLFTSTKTLPKHFRAVEEVRRFDLVGHM